MKIFPFFDEVLVNIVEVDHVTKGGLFVAPTTTKAYEVGDVLAMGADVEPEISIGDRVIFSKGAAIKVECDGGDNCALVKCKSILGCYVE
jgi:chaperonin GroES